MNILIQCNEQNYKEIEILLYSVQQYNRYIHWYVILTDEISNKQKKKLQRIVKYLDTLSDIIFISFENKSLDQQFPYLEEIICMNSSVINCSSIEQQYDELIQSNIPIFVNQHPKGDIALIFFNLRICKENNIHPMLTDGFKINFLGAKAPYQYLPREFGYCEDFYAPIEPKLVYLDENHPRILEVDENYWCRLYPQFSYIIDRLHLLDTINF